jgi:hypothetical protein
MCHKASTDCENNDLIGNVGIWFMMMNKCKFLIGNVI